MIECQSMAAALWAESFCTDWTLTHFVKYSTATMKYYTRTDGRGTKTVSISTVLKGQEVPSSWSGQRLWPARTFDKPDRCQGFSWRSEGGLATRSWPGKSSRGEASGNALPVLVEVWDDLALSWWVDLDVVPLEGHIVLLVVFCGDLWQRG